MNDNKVTPKYIASEMATDAELLEEKEAREEADTQLSNRITKIDNVFSATQEPTGFVNRTDSTLFFDNATRTLSITPVGSNFKIFIQGQEITISEPLTKQIPDVSGSYFFFINGDSELNYLTTFNVSLFTTSAYCAYVLWDENDDKAITFAEERHGIVMDGATHSYLHTTRGTQLVSGASIGFTTSGDGTNNSDAQISISDSVVSDEDIRIQITNNAAPTLPHQQILFPIAEIPVYYLQDSTWRKSVATQFPMLYGSSRAKFNKNTSNVWSLEEASMNGKYLVSYIFATTNIIEPIIAILGQEEYEDLADATARASWSSIDFGDLPAQEIKLLYTIYYETSSAFTNTPKSTIRNIGDVRFGVDRETSAVSFNTSHANLSGLGLDDHLQYLLVNGTRPMEGSLDMDEYDINNVDVVTANDVSADTVTAVNSVMQKKVTTPTYTTATNNATLTLTSASSTVHFITGTATGFSIVFPDATTLPLGINYEIYNRSSAPITLKYSDGSVIGVLSSESVSSLILQGNATPKGIFSPFTVEVAQAAGIQNYSNSTATPFATSSATDVQITGFTITPMAGQYFIIFNSSNQTLANNALNYISLYKDGVQIASSERVAQGVSQNFVFMLSTQAVVSFNGNEQLRVYARVSTGTLTINARSVVMLRLGPAV